MFAIFYVCAKHIEELLADDPLIMNLEQPVEYSVDYR
jgi:hypothetical protein